MMHILKLFKEACERCRQRKVKCDKRIPCSYCQKKELSCEYAAFKTPEIEQHKKAEHQGMRDEAQYNASYDPYFTLPIPILAQSSQLEDFSNFAPMQQLSFQNPPQYSPAPFPQGGELEFNLTQSHPAFYWEIGMLKREIGMLKSDMRMLKSILNEGDSKSSR